MCNTITLAVIFCISVCYLDIAIGKELPTYNWLVHKENAEIPSNAVKIGKDKNNNDIYIGHARAEDKHFLGVTINPAIGKTDYYYTSNKEDADTPKEHMILINYSKAKPVWVSVRFGKIPKDAVFAGYGDTGKKHYVGRVFNDGSIKPGFIISEDSTLWTNGYVRSFDHFDVLVNRLDD